VLEIGRMVGIVVEEIWLEDVTVVVAIPRTDETII
jgi:hypothetical protein